MSAPRNRVLVLNWRDPWHPEAGGSELYVTEVARRLHAGGTALTVFSARYPGAAEAETRDGIRYVRRGGHLTVYLWAALLLLTRRFGRLDAVLEVQNGMPFLARLFTRARVVVLVHHVHREQWSILPRALARFGWFMESKVAVRVNRGTPYVAVSEVTRSELVGAGCAGGRHHHRLERPTGRPRLRRRRALRGATAGHARPARPSQARRARARRRGGAPRRVPRPAPAGDGVGLVGRQPPRTPPRARPRRRRHASWVM